MKEFKTESEPLLRESVLGKTQGELKDSPVPGTATATGKSPSNSLRLVRKR